MSAASRRRWLRRWRSLPLAARVITGLALAAGVALAANAIYQVARKPTELFFPVSGVLAKTPAATWRDYGSAFRRFATPTVTPALLAALAQVEGSGNPLVRTYWRWRWAARPRAPWACTRSPTGLLPRHAAIAFTITAWCARVAGTTGTRVGSTRCTCGYCPRM